MLYCYFLSEVTDGIEIKVLLGKPNQRDNICIDTAKIIHDGDELRFRLSNKVYDPNSKLIIESRIYETDLCQNDERKYLKYKFKYLKLKQDLK
jgi:hypothetical protein